MAQATVAGLVGRGHAVDVIQDSYQDFGAGQFIWRLGDPAVDGISRRAMHGATAWPPASSARPRSTRLAPRAASLHQPLDVALGHRRCRAAGASPQWTTCGQANSAATTSTWASELRQRARARARRARGVGSDRGAPSRPRSRAAAAGSRPAARAASAPRPRPRRAPRASSGGMTIGMTRKIISNASSTNEQATSAERARRRAAARGRAASAPARRRPARRCAKRAQHEREARGGDEQRHQHAGEHHRVGEHGAQQRPRRAGAPRRPRRAAPPRRSPPPRPRRAGRSRRRRAARR